MTIIIDSREPRNIIEKLSTKIRVEKELIEVGDYLLPNGYVIERKKDGDLMASIGNNRLFEQLNNMMQADFPVLCIVCDNVWKTFYFSKNRFIHKQYIGTLTTITCKYPKLKVIFLDSDDMFVGYITSLHNKLLEDGHNERPSPIQKKPKSLKIRKENMLCASKGIAVKSAKRLLKRYKSISDICDADLEDIKKTKKISKSQAENIYEILHK